MIQHSSVRVCLLSVAIASWGFIVNTCYVDVCLRRFACVARIVTGMCGGLSSSKGDEIEVAAKSRLWAADRNVV